MTPKHTPVPEMSATNLAQKVVAKMDLTNRGRKAENVLAYAGAIQVAFVGVLEGLQHYGIVGVRTEYNSIADVLYGLPWFNLIAIVICVAPKTLGRATVGKYLDKLPFIGGGRG